MGIDDYIVPLSFLSLFSICGFYFVLFLCTDIKSFMVVKAKIIVHKSARREVKDKLLKRNHFQKLINKRREGKKIQNCEKGAVREKTKNFRPLRTLERNFISLLIKFTFKFMAPFMLLLGVISGACIHSYYTLFFLRNAHCLVKASAEND